MTSPMRILQSGTPPINRTRKGGVLTNKKKIQKTLRISEEESLIINKEARKYGLSVNQYFKLLLLHRPNDYPEIRELLSNLVVEFNHIGNNINQIARNANSGFYSESEKELLLAYIKKLYDQTRKVVSEIVNYKDPKH